MKRYIRSSVSNINYSEKTHLYYYQYGKYTIMRQTEEEVEEAVRQLKENPDCITKLVEKNPEF